MGKKKKNKTNLFSDTVVADFKVYHPASSISPWHGSLLHRLSGDLTPIHSIPVGKAAHEAFDSSEFHFAKHPINIHTFVTRSSGQALA